MPTYRAIGGGAGVDESLFGSKKKKGGRGGQISANAVVISRDELSAIRSRSVVKSAADIRRCVCVCVCVCVWVGGWVGVGVL